MIELTYFEISICAERPLTVLAEKGVTDWAPRHIHLFKGERFDPAYLKLNPKAQVPTLVHNGAAIREATLICNYLDELYPDPPLKAAAPVARAYARMDRGSGRARPRARRLAFLRRDLPDQADGHAGRRAQRLPGRPDGARTHPAAAVPRFTPNQPTEYPSFTH